jgi:hypothetical protein
MKDTIEAVEAVANDNEGVFCHKIFVSCFPDDPRIATKIAEVKGNAAPCQSYASIS